MKTAPCPLLRCALRSCRRAARRDGGPPPAPGRGRRGCACSTSRPGGSARRRGAGNRRDAFAGVLDHEAHGGGRSALHAHGDAAAARRELTAFAARFPTICRRRSGSPTTRPALGSSTVWILRLFAVARRHQRLDGGGGDGRELKGRTFKRNFAPTIRDRSRMSEMTWACAAALRSMASRPRRAVASSSRPPRSR